jgi:hypothetical protein
VLNRTTRTAPITTDADFAAVLDDLAERLDGYGRKLSDIDIVGSIALTQAGLSDPPAYVDGLAELAKLGVTWTHAPVRRGTLSESLDAIAQFGEEVTAKL